MEKGTGKVVRPLLFLALLSLAAWSQPSPTPNPDLDPSIRHASETDKSPIFGYMINARTGESRGNSLGSIYRQCMLPGMICLVLSPVYFRLSRRRTTRVPSTPT